MRREKPVFTVIQDTREQWPWKFGKPHRRELEDGGVMEIALDAGDYSCQLDGELLDVRIERKMLGDYFGVVGKGRDRFERELERLQKYASFLVIEATAQKIWTGYEHSLVSGEAALGSALAWSNDFGVRPIFAGNRTLAQRIAWGILEDFAAKVANER